MVWKSNLNEIETEALDTTSGLSKKGSTTAAVTGPTTGARPGSSRGNKPTTGAGSARGKVATAPVHSAPSPNKMAAAAAEADYAPYVPGAGVTGSGEELAMTLEKIVSQLDIISRTLQMLEQRASMNEEAVHNCLEYFKEAKNARES